MIWPRMMVVVAGALVLYSYQTPRETDFAEPPVAVVAQTSFFSSPLTKSDQQTAQQLTSTSEWLGPLAPIAISPFFGITCLAGIAQFGADYFPTNGFISNNPVLKNPAVFWIFLVLTLLTSLPRLTKVSKPVAQALDQVETYAGILTILILRFAVAPPDPNEQVAVVQMGFLSFSADVLLSIAAIINIIVINSIKFFFEILVWLIPFPFVDALLEACNKSLCAGLMAIYAWSPLVATMINLVLFGISLMAFNWVRRRIVLMRTMLIEPLWTWVSPKYGSAASIEEIVVFTKNAAGPFPAKAKVMLSRTDQGWQLRQRRWIFGDRLMDLNYGQVEMEIHEGLLINSIVAEDKSKENTTSPIGNLELYFSRRFNDDLDTLADRMRIERSSEQLEVAVQL
ncbi:MAG: hypothetical protein AAFN77_19615 [Planctomycetota bacterium]